MMSRHPRRTGAVSGLPHTDHRDDPAAGSSSDDRYAQDLPALRAAVRAMPVSAARLLQNLLRAHGSAETAQGVDLMILLATPLTSCLLRLPAVARPGAAVSAASDNGGAPDLIIIDPGTGNLLAHEKAALPDPGALGSTAPTVLTYTLYVARAHTATVDQR